MPTSLSVKASFAVLLAVFCFVPAASAAQAPVVSLRGITDSRIQTLENLHLKAEEHILKNDFRDAIRVYDEIILEEPDDETAYTGLGQCYLVLGDFAQAKNAYLNALHINPNNDTARLGLEKIINPDSMNFTDLHTAQPEEPAIPTPVPAEIPVRYPENNPDKNSEKSAQESGTEETQSEIALGAKKTMAPYSIGIPKPIQGLSREQLIQAALKNAGFYRGPIDGILGASTQKAVRGFQKKYELVADGKVGPQTWRLLQPYINQNGFEEKILKNGTSV